MAKTKEVRPIFETKFEFIASLDRFMHEAGMLRDAVRQLLQMGQLPNSVRGILQKRLDAFDVTRIGETDK